ncbi:DJ-1 family glyoxalase III [Treponema sp. OMZ 855]|uniref:DJ-1 family glyoxalase III n=1 Tax=Treponema sp. OMZ 855 TaxID=1643512 RepID=UPI0020A3B5AC|nr:DJ-1 family glyoxalase III [Treponema sp. OMZ 855]UTC49901.1 DJ-1/PfpI family protein [Treponema sp. OMZ 855]
MQRVFLFIADGFEEVEAITPLDYLRRCGADLTLVGVGAKIIRSSRGLAVTCDLALSELIGEGADAKKNAEQLAADTVLAILPGGLPNSRTLSESTDLRFFITETAKHGGLVAAICAAPALALGEWGLLDGKQFTCYPGMGEDLSTKPVTGARVIRDGQFITACGAGAAEEFAFALADALYGEKKLAELKSSIVAR